MKKLLSEGTGWRMENVRREVVFAVLAAESYIVEWVRDFGNRRRLF